jgi:hypothetical protein
MEWNGSDYYMQKLIHFESFKDTNRQFSYT